MKKVLLVAVGLVLVAYVALSTHYVEVRSFIFQSLHNNPVQWRSVTISYEYEMRYFESDQAIHFLYWGGEIKGGLSCSETPYKTLEQVKRFYEQKREFEIEHIKRENFNDSDVVVTEFVDRKSGAYSYLRFF